MIQDFVFEFIGGGSIGNMNTAFVPIDEASYAQRNNATGGKRALIHKAFGAEVVRGAAGPMDRPTLDSCVKEIRDATRAGTCGKIMLFGSSLGCYYALRLAELLSAFVPVTAISLGDLPIMSLGFPDMDKELSTIIPINEPPFFGHGTPIVNDPGGYSALSLTNYYQIDGNRWAPTRQAPIPGANRWWCSNMTSLGGTPGFVKTTHDLVYGTSTEVHGTIVPGDGKNIWTNILIDASSKSNDDDRHDFCGRQAERLTGPIFNPLLMAGF